MLATQVENMIVSSADLSNSDKTDGFLKKTHAFVKGDFSGAFLQAGVAELTMACVCIGMSLHGGVIVACGTFFVFSDYMKPAIRMAALMEQPVKFIWSHDAFRVGEDLSLIHISYSSATSGKIWNGSSGFPPKFRMVSAIETPAAERGCPCVDTLFS